MKKKLNLQLDTNNLYLSLKKYWAGTKKPIKTFLQIVDIFVKSCPIIPLKKKRKEKQRKQYIRTMLSPWAWNIELIVYHKITLSPKYQAYSIRKSYTEFQINV